MTVLKDFDRVEPEPRPPGACILRIFPVARRPLSRVPRAQPPRRGVPGTAEEWTALVKVASGERGIPGSSCERLLELGLVVTVAGIPKLTRHGRLTLGLPE